MRGLLDFYIEGSRRALRLRTEGRSTAKGPRPSWIDAAVHAAIEIKPGSTLIEIDALSLLKAVPDQFVQLDFFPELDVDLPAFDYLVDSLRAATTEQGDASLYDRELLEFLRGHEALFKTYGVDAIEFRHRVDGPPELELQRGALASLRTLAHRIPRPQHVRLAGHLETIRHSDLTFSVLVSGTGVRGVADPACAEALRELWGTDVVVSGEAHFTLRGDIQRIEAVRFLAATQPELELWGNLPAPLEHAPASLHKPQGPRSGLSAVFGKWPGDESDADVAAALDALS